jgi:fructokinase
MKPYAITALGELLIDYTPMPRSDSGMRVFEQNPGGAPANVLACAARLGCRTAMIGKVGDDMQGRFLRETLDAAGVDTCGLAVDTGCFTTLAFVSLSDEGERSFSFARKPGADTLLRPDEVRPELLTGTEIFHFGSLSLTDEPARSATLQAIEIAKAAGAVISYDPNYRPALWPDEASAKLRIQSALPGVDILKCSDDETEVVTGEADPERAARRLLDQGLSCVVVTRGARGALVMARDGQVRSIPAAPCHPRDTTGAGDAFWGALLTRLHETGRRPEELDVEELASYAVFGCASAACCVERRGAIPAMPTREEVLRRLEAGA